MISIIDIRKSARAERMRFRWFPILADQSFFVRIEWLNYWLVFDVRWVGYLVYGLMLSNPPTALLLTLLWS